MNLLFKKNCTISQILHKSNLIEQCLKQILTNILKNTQYDKSADIAYLTLAVTYADSWYGPHKYSINGLAPIL